MPEYFSGFYYQKKIETKPFYKTVPIISAIAGKLEKIDLETIFKGLDEDFSNQDDWIIEDQKKGWKRAQARKTFDHVLDQMAKEYNDPSLNMRGILLNFVTKKTLARKITANLDSHKKRYTHKIFETSGLCVPTENNTYALLIGLAKQEKTTSLDEVLALMSHEYGHTLDRQKRNPMFEELKAYTFQNLFLRFLNNVDGYDPDRPKVNSLHTKSKDYLAQLMAKGMTEEIILAHLLERNFGPATPSDYKKYL